jgi:hypothetical protein
MGSFSREGYNAIVAIQGQTIVQATIQSLIPRCDDVALVAIGLQFEEGLPQHVSQDSAEGYCQELRKHVRGSDIIYLYSNNTGQYGLFFVLPEANMEGGQIVHQRLQEFLTSSVLSQTTLAIPEHIEIRRYASSDKGTSLIEAPSYTDMEVRSGTISVQLLPTQSRLPPAADQVEHLFLPSPEEVASKDEQ